jgi:uncharacterized protein (TIGR00255 family)
MIKGMTGFAEAEIGVKDGSLHLVARTVNGRYLEPRVKLPSGLVCLEEKVIECLKTILQRGRIDISVSWRQGGTAPRIDRKLAKAYLTELRDAAKALGLKGEQISPGELLRLPGVLDVRENTQATVIWRKLRPALLRVLRGVESMRCKEGAATERDLRNRLARLGRLVAKVRQAERASASRKQKLLGGRIKELGGTEARAAAWGEIVRAVERMNIDEELQRTTAHLEFFAKCLRQKGMVGGKLDYIIQELGREVNTTGSKSDDKVVRQTVVEMKEELNRMREQVQNIE